MRHETNNEMDLLLRRLSRRQGVPPSDADSDHLDADELSSYAENVLPAPARARYTDHLAECSRCRELVVQLSGSVPVVAAKENLTAVGATGLSKFLANLFSPMVLRYAVPALGLIIAAVIGVMVLRSRQGETFVAQLEKAPQPASEPTPNQQPQTAERALDKEGQRESQSPSAARGVLKDRPSVAQSAPPPNAAPVVGNVRVEPKADASAAKAEDQAAANPAPTPAPQASKPAETVDEMRVEVEGRKAKTPVRAATASKVAKENNYEAPPAQQKKTDDLSTLRPGAAPATDSRTQGGGTASLRRREETEKDRQDSETRSISGRRFRKQSGIWVDTAYASGSATVNIARGSEQYRALIADEPAIKTIADQLDGQIIVVWNGRAYRIR